MTSKLVELTISVKDPSQTEKLAEKIGQKLKGGEVIELSGDLGSGKTTFVRGLVRGAGSKDKVASPTFTISRVYKSKKLTINHLDFYRLNEPGIVARELSELLDDDSTVLVIEWAKITYGILPENRLQINFKPTSEKGRQISFATGEKFGYLLNDLDGKNVSSN